MQWQDIRTHYPQQWLLVEALAARSENNQRVLEQLAVVNTYADSATALRGYAELHRKSPDRELYVLHTSRETPDISERRWLGIRAGVCTSAAVDLSRLEVGPPP